MYHQQSDLTTGKNIHRMSEHKGNTTHKECISALRVLVRQTGRLDKTLAAQTQNEQDYLRNALRRVVSFVKFFASRALPSRVRD